MTFLPKRDLLTLEEMERLCRAFVFRGVRKIRVTGGEPLVRKNVMHLFRGLGRLLEGNGPDGGSLDELTLTTNGTQLAKHADALAACGVRRVNVSLDSLDPDRFQRITRRGSLDAVIEGIAAACAAGLRVKINAVAMRGLNEDELDRLVGWCGERGLDLCFIETMPMGDIEPERINQYLPLSAVRERLERTWTLRDTDFRTGGPARYVDVAETGQRLGFITPMTHNFCESCNRVRVTCTGTLFMCLGQEDAVDLRAPLRAFPDDDGPLLEAIDAAIARKPQGHDFVIDRERGARPAVGRHMSVTGG